MKQIKKDKSKIIIKKSRASFLTNRLKEIWESIWHTRAQRELNNEYVRLAKKTGTFTTRKIKG